MDIVVYETSSGRVLGYQRSAGVIPPGNTLVWDSPNNSHTAGQVNYFNSLRVALDALVGVPINHWKVVDLLPVELSQGEKDALAQAEADALEASVRDGAKALFEGFLTSPLFLRSLADIIRGEINILRARDRDYEANFQAATSLANLKTLMAALPTLADRTLAQLKTAIQNRIDDGSVD